MFFHVSGQIITTDPPNPVTNQQVIIIYDATQGNAGLAGYTGDVYAHTGVITELSASGSDWKYVKTSWGQNTPETKLERIDQDLYQLVITPEIRGYYGVPQDENILQMAFVFRSAEPVGGNYLEGKTETYGDIFVNVLEPGSLTFIQPENRPVILELNDTMVVEVLAYEADSIALFVDDVLIMKNEGDHILDTVIADGYGKFWVKAMAWQGGGAIADSFFYFVREPVTLKPLPEGIRDGINYVDDNSVILSIFAPHKEFIYVLGDFNNWEAGEESYMFMTPDSNRFWIELNGLETGMEYVFQYFIDGEIRVGDPYADKVSDPWNDKYISDATYPGLIEYPDGKTSGVAAVLQTAQEEYQWVVQNFIPAKTTDLVIYELLVRDFTAQHTYKAMADTLDYLKHLGVNAIELMPVNEFEGNSSWGYNPSYYFAPDKYYGPKNELKKFIDACHERDIAVLLDLVLNHAYNQCPMVQMYFDGTNPTPDNPWFNVHSNFTNPDAQWGNDYNHESLQTQQLVDSINSYWMSEYKFDGFRFDFTKGFGNNIKGPDDPWGSKYDADRIRLLKRMSDEIWLRNPNAIVIFEHLSENSEEKELANYGILLWGNMSHSYGDGAMGWNNNGKSDFSWISNQSRGWDNPHVVGYMESHDEERLMHKCVTSGNGSGDYQIKDTTTALNRMQLDALFFLTIPGPKMIWQFGEMGYDYSINYNGRLGEKPVRWDYYYDFRRKYLYDFYRTLADLRVSQPAFETTDYDLAVSTGMKRIILRHESMDVVIVGNFGVTENEMFPGFTHTGTWYDYFSGQPVEVASTSETISLEQGEYHLFTDVQLPTPEISTGLEESVMDDTGHFLVFPNPSNGEITIILNDTHKGLASVELFNMLGERIGVLYEGETNQGDMLFSGNLNSAGSRSLSPGIYFLKIRTGDRKEVKKIILL